MGNPNESGKCNGAAREWEVARSNTVPSSSRFRQEIEKLGTNCPVQRRVLAGAVTIPAPGGRDAHPEHVNQRTIARTSRGVRVEKVAADSSDGKTKKQRSATVNSNHLIADPAAAL